jgi:hypothetical protein
VLPSDFVVDLALWWRIFGGFVVVINLLKDFDFGDVGELVDCGGAIAVLVVGAFSAAR